MSILRIKSDEKLQTHKNMMYRLMKTNYGKSVKRNSNDQHFKRNEEKNYLSTDKK